jgi:deazaflavin-dependent oxidoreductase (nitroreductase family)
MNVKLSLEQQPQFLYLTTIEWKGGKEHKIEIWFIVYNNKYYVMSENGRTAHWVHNILSNPKVLVAIKDKTFEGNARIVDKETDPKIVAEVSNRIRTKNDCNDGLIIEITSRAIY